MLNNHNNCLGQQDGSDYLDHLCTDHFQAILTNHDQLVGVLSDKAFFGVCSDALRGFLMNLEPLSVIHGKGRRFFYNHNGTVYARDRIDGYQLITGMAGVVNMVLVRSGYSFSYVVARNSNDQKKIENRIIQIIELQPPEFILIPPRT